MVTTLSFTFMCERISSDSARCWYCLYASLPICIEGLNFDTAAVVRFCAPQFRVLIFAHWISLFSLVSIFSSISLVLVMQICKPLFRIVRFAWTREVITLSSWYKLHGDSRTWRHISNSGPHFALDADSYDELVAFPKHFLSGGAKTTKHFVGFGECLNKSAQKQFVWNPLTLKQRELNLEYNELLYHVCFDTDWRT